MGGSQLPMNHVPKVTVLMSVYNGGRYLREAIESISNQTFSDFEFLIINDGSTDQSRDIIRAYHDPRIRLIDNERNLGLTKSLNRGIAVAQGDYLARMDADDVSVPERFATQVEFLDSHPEAALVGSAIVTINEHHEELGPSPLPVADHLILTQLFFGNAFFHASIMGRTGVFQEFWYDDDVAYAQDYLLWSRIALKYPVANLKEPLLHFRAHDASISRQKFAQQEETAKHVSRLHLETLLQMAVPSDVLERHYQLITYRMKLKTLSRNDRLRMLKWLDLLAGANKRRQLYDHSFFCQCLNGHWNALFSDDVFYHGGLAAMGLLFSPCRQFTNAEKASHLLQYAWHALLYIMKHFRKKGQ